MKADALDKLVQARSSLPNMSALAEALVDRFEGIDGLASEIHLEVQTTKKGTPGRARLLCAVVDLIKAVSVKGAKTDPLGGMTTDQLTSCIREITRDDREQVSDPGRDSFATPRG